MTKITLIDKIREVYSRGENVMEFLKNEGDLRNDEESIMISYDFQAGTYTKLYSKLIDYWETYTNAVSEVWAELGPWQSAMEVGVGEGQLIAPLMAKLDPEGIHDVLGFDISWSRTRYALDNVEKAGRNAQLFVANLFEIPLEDNAVDIVYTSHSLEPNGGREDAALNELYRVARRYVVLLEPDYAAASLEGKARMDQHGYVRDLGRHARNLGYKVVEDRSFEEISSNPLNPTRLTVIRKTEAPSASTNFVCPITRASLVRRGDVFFSPDSGLIYPVIDGLPCLMGSSATLGVHFEKFNPR